MEGAKMSQKEYLRKYLNDGDIDSKKKMKKKKKKRAAIGTKTVKIIDDDIDLKNIRPIEDGEFQILNTTEDAPQIVGIVDERGPAVDFADKRRWRIIADDGDGNVTCGVSNDRSKDFDNNPRSSDKRRPEKSPIAEDSDLSPPRISRKASPSEKKSKRKRREPSSESSSSSDLSSPRIKTKRRGKHKRKNDRSDSDQSPPRRKASTDKSSESLKNPKSSVRLKEKPSARRCSDSDQSPPRRQTNNDKSSGISRNFKNSGTNSARADRDSRLKQKPSVRGCSDSDQSPPRRKRKNDESMRSSKDSESDFSPPRRKRKDERGSGRNDRVSSRSSRDARDTRSRDDSRREKRNNRRDEQNNPRGSRSRWNDDERPPKRPSRSPEAMSQDDNAGSGRMKKTLDGKTAGLQEARDLKLETEAYKKREAESFKQLSSEVSGVGQAAIFRDRKTGRRRDLAAEAAQRREKDKRQAEIDEKYAKWGRGLKQVDDETEKRERDLYEMSKPLARYANDADLDKALREVEREGDTMLDEIRKRRIKEGKCEPVRPIYQGSYAPNRFGIKPGHRWDGVDRSNGYEKKWFEARNARKAIAEEAYKWSTADM